MGVGDLDRTLNLVVLVPMPLPAVFANFHRPMYISSTNNDEPGGDQPVAALLRQHVEPLFLDAGGAPVDLVLHGHHHSYQRHSSVFNGTVYARSRPYNGEEHVFVAPPMPVQTVIGMAGAGFSTNVQDPPPAFNELVLFNHGYARITLHNASVLEFRLYEDVAGTVADKWWIVR
jgi:hypothetical protein